MTVCDATPHQQPREDNMALDKDKTYSVQEFFADDPEKAYR